MKAIVCKEFGPLDDLDYKDVPDPRPGPGQVLIRTEAAGVNYPDGLIVQGLYQSKPDRPFTPGSEVAGEIVAVGDGVTRFRQGDRVVTYCSGGYAEMAVGSERTCFSLPEGMDAADACAMIIAWGTSHHALKQRANIQPGETLVIFGAAGATGTAAIQIGKVMGATVIAVCSSDEKQKIATEQGADHVIGYDNLKDEVKALTGGKGADVVYDSVGGDAFKAASRFMAPNGRLLVIGFASGEIPQLPVNLTLVKEYSVVGVFWGNWTRREPEAYLANMDELFGWYAEGKVKPLIEGRYPLADAADVLKRVMNRGAVGKIALVP
ncbi:oxidoreductase, zinc-binding [Pseudooceanicola batsensis HTCC2597]|uniref:Oxidoreductase, zinc-binding n=1 Tax=Pseudooceanicola batsensis (strain ATCC BAA-863 / DSM 15984 / KCTC 12145 / HTCC2597) TaxID=252305 RepID=A3TVY2_PSEBH|nr:NADPH:quinone oxidoreductase family protein [Pseudooceanicola batsensis]EAQ03778.1 oxidoreductase, zinc-binding [Pseudooceanicola batsensis HTCC2597]